MVNKHKRVKLIILVGFIGILICAFYSGLTIRTYTLQTDKISEDSSIRIVLIADLHSTIYGKDQQALIQKVQSQNPDLILLTGDIADDNVPITGTELFLDGIRDIAPIYYVTGNHEYWSNDVEAICDIIAAYGVRILQDEYEQININGNDLIIAGVNDPDKKRYGWPEYDQAAEMQAKFTELADCDAYKILLAHRPERIAEYAEYAFDLVVSGHSHGGQVRIPFLVNGLFAPNQGWFPPYAGGLYEHDRLVHIVSRGLSINPKLPRIFNPPEIVVIIL